MSDFINFQVNPRLTQLLGEVYRSSEAALKELVDNAWDADATLVNITLPSIPEFMNGKSISIEDNGSGMSESVVREEYLDIAGDKQKRQGALSPKFRRKIKGRKGIGKFAGLALGTLMTVRSTSDEKTGCLKIDKLEIVNNKNDLENIT